MTSRSSISRQVQLQAVAPIESSIPADMTVQQWRRQRSAGRVMPIRRHKQPIRRAA